MTHSDKKTPEMIRNRISNFWRTEIRPLRKTDATILIVSHGGLISTLRHYLLSHNYRVHESIKYTRWEVPNCSISEIILGEKGPGEFIRFGDWHHLRKALDSQDRLENSTG
jgi:broad specificity phosphatase PhoE